MDDSRTAQREDAGPAFLAMLPELRTAGRLRAHLTNRGGSIFGMENGGTGKDVGAGESSKLSGESKHKSRFCKNLKCWYISVLKRIL